MRRPERVTILFIVWLLVAFVYVLVTPLPHVVTRYVPQVDSGRTIPVCDKPLWERIEDGCDE